MAAPKVSKSSKSGTTFLNLTKTVKLAQSPKNKTSKLEKKKR